MSDFLNIFIILSIALFVTVILILVFKRKNRNLYNNQAPSDQKQYEINCIIISISLTIILLI